MDIITMIPIIISGINLLIIPIALWRLNYFTNKKIEEIKRQTDLKIKTYNKIFQTFNPVLTKTKYKEMTALDRIEMTIDLIQYAPDEIIRLYNLFWDAAKKDMQNVDLHIIYNDILLAVRKDLGYRDTQITRNDINKMLIGKEE